MAGVEAIIYVLAYQLTMRWVGHTYTADEWVGHNCDE